MQFEMTLKRILVFDAAGAAIFILLARLFPARGSELSIMAGFLVVLFLLHLLILPFKGQDFVMRDAPPKSLLRYYGFMVFVVAAFAATWAGNLLWTYLQ